MRRNIGNSPPLLLLLLLLLLSHLRQQKLSQLLPLLLLQFFVATAPTRITLTPASISVATGKSLVRHGNSILPSFEPSWTMSKPKACPNGTNQKLATPPSKSSRNNTEDP